MVNRRRVHYLFEYLERDKSAKRFDLLNEDDEGGLSAEKAKEKRKSSQPHQWSRFFEERIRNDVKKRFKEEKPTGENDYMTKQRFKRYLSTEFTEEKYLSWWNKNIKNYKQKGPNFDTVYEDLKNDDWEQMLDQFNNQEVELTPDEWINLIQDYIMFKYQQYTIEAAAEEWRGNGEDDDVISGMTKTLEDISNGEYIGDILAHDFTGESAAMYSPKGSVQAVQVVIDFDFLDSADPNILKNFLNGLEKLQSNEDEENNSEEAEGDEETMNEDDDQNDKNEEKDLLTKFLEEYAKDYKNHVVVRGEELKGTIVAHKRLLLPQEFARQIDTLNNDTGILTLLRNKLGGSKPEGYLERLADIDIEIEKIEDKLRKAGININRQKKYLDKYGKQDSGKKLNELFLKNFSELENDIQKQILKLLGPDYLDYDKKLIHNETEDYIAFQDIHPETQKLYTDNDNKLKIKLKKRYNESNQASNLDELYLFPKDLDTFLNNIKDDEDVFSNIEWNKNEKDFEGERLNVVEEKNVNYLIYKIDG
jgi:hypothetical protein